MGIVRWRRREQQNSRRRSHTECGNMEGEMAWEKEEQGEETEQCLSVQRRQAWQPASASPVCSARQEPPQKRNVSPCSASAAGRLMPRQRACKKGQQNNATSNKQGKRGRSRNKRVGWACWSATCYVRGKEASNQKEEPGGACPKSPPKRPKPVPKSFLPPQCTCYGQFVCSAGAAREGSSSSHEHNTCLPLKTSSCLFFLLLERYTCHRG